MATSQRPCPRQTSPPMPHFLCYPIRTSRNRSAGSRNLFAWMSLSPWTSRIQQHMRMNCRILCGPGKPLVESARGTRRGFGAIHCLDSKEPYPAQPERIRERIAQRLKDITRVRSGLQDVPLLIPNLVFQILGTAKDPSRPFDDPISAWQDVIAGLNAFRQARYGSKYGLSRWPEANEIRRYHGIAPKLPADQPSSRLVQSFPRAAFGLPIVFHMPHDRAIRDELTLEGAPDDVRRLKFERLASRLILRPLVCADGRAVALAAVLDGPAEPPLGLRLIGAPRNPAVSMRLSPQDAKQVDPLNGTPDVLRAFLDWL